MANRPYFSISRASFEKNAGYKSTVHALAELIDNAFEAGADRVAVILMVDQNSRLQKIAVADNGKGMDPNLLQMAICEKAGKYMDRQHGGGPDSRRKLGKYGVGLPKASISQCNKFTVWSWESGGPSKAYTNSVDITDDAWIAKGAQVSDSEKGAAPRAWLTVADLQNAKSGTLILWEELDGVTWARAQWGENSGLIPNLEFRIGRVYRKMICAGELEAAVVVVDKHFNTLTTKIIEANDPLYLTPGQKVARKLHHGESWPPDDPLFDNVELTDDESKMEIEIPVHRKLKKVSVGWRGSAARRNAFAQLEKINAGNLPHGEHAKKNVGLSILREGREINLSDALANPSEPRERWFGVEVDLPHELDTILGMTNNKQEYTRLEQVLREKQEEYLQEGETTQKCLTRIEKEDNSLSICLRIAWHTQDVWKKVKNLHMGMRPEIVGKPPKEDGGKPAPGTPEDEAEDTATKVDPPNPIKPKSEKKLKNEIMDRLTGKGVPKPQAEQIAARIVDRGLSYSISEQGSLGSPFFTVMDIKGIKFLTLNQDHSINKFFKSIITPTEKLSEAQLRSRLSDAKLAMLLMLESWAKIEADAVDKEKQQLIRLREDWGRMVGKMVDRLQKDRGEDGDED
jgi:hypothetical protein